MKHPFTCLVAGPTGSGKTYFVSQLVKHYKEMIDPSPQRIMWCYGEWQPLYASLQEVDFLEGLPETSALDRNTRTLLVIDDLMSETDDRVTKLFTKISHHRNTSVVHIVQNVFDKGKHQRTISLNTQYMVMFKNPRDTTQITHLAKQMYPGHVKFVQEAFIHATSKPHGYLFIDLKQDTPDHLRLRTSVFPGQIQYVYMRKI